MFFFTCSFMITTSAIFVSSPLVLSGIAWWIFKNETGIKGTLHRNGPLWCILFAKKFSRATDLLITGRCSGKPDSSAHNHEFPRSMA
jgi:hypothetical protein